MSFQISIYFAGGEDMARECLRDEGFTADAPYPHHLLHKDHEELMVYIAPRKTEKMQYPKEIKPEHRHYIQYTHRTKDAPDVTFLKVLEKILVKLGDYTILPGVMAIDKHTKTLDFRDLKQMRE